MFCERLYQVEKKKKKMRSIKPSILYTILPY